MGVANHYQSQGKDICAKVELELPGKIWVREFTIPMMLLITSVF